MTGSRWCAAVRKEGVEGKIAQQRILTGGERGERRERGDAAKWRPAPAHEHRHTRTNRYHGLLTGTPSAPPCKTKGEARKKKSTAGLEEH